MFVSFNSSILQIISSRSSSDKKAKAIVREMNSNPKTYSSTSIFYYLQSLLQLEDFVKYFEIISNLMREYKGYDFSQALEAHISQSGLPLFKAFVLKVLHYLSFSFSFSFFVCFISFSFSFSFSSFLVLFHFLF